MKKIGIIGKTTITTRERAQLRYLGRCLARLGHPIVVVPAKGTVDAVREGVKSENGEIVEIDKGVIDTADNTWVLTSRRLLSRLLTVYPDLHDKDNVAVFDSKELDEVIRLTNEALKRQNIEPPA